MQRYSIFVTSPSKKQIEITVDTSIMLGSGAYGKVYLGCLDEAQELLGVKVINIKKREQQLRCEAEIAIMMELANAPNVVNLVGYKKHYFEQAVNCSYVTIAMSYAVNGTVADWLAGKKQAYPYFSFKQQMNIIRGVANGLAYMHGLDIVHGDVKPWNILLDDEMQPLLCDLGAAKRIGKDNLGSFDGTVIYMSPKLLTARFFRRYYPSNELFTNSKYNKSDDVYSFSLTACNIIALKLYLLPDDIKDETQLMTWLTHDNRPSIPSQYPKEVKEVITRGWSTFEIERPTAKEALTLLDEKDQNIEPVINADESETSSCFSWLFSLFKFLFEGCAPHEEKVHLFTRQII